MTVDVSHLPRTGTTVPGVAWTSPEDVDAAVRAAIAATGDVARAHPRERTAWIESMAAAVESNAEELVDIADEETALGRERLSGELSRGAVNMRYYAAVGERGEWLAVRHQVLPGPPPVDLRRANLPVGPVAVFGASNFPFQFGVLGHDTCSAIAAGCPVVVKAHPAHPRLSARLIELARAALRASGAPDGLLSLVVGFDAGLALVDASGIQAVGFTGSQQAGMALVERASRRERPIPVYAEMGTVNPVLVTPRAADRVPSIAEEFVQAVNLGGGQFCTKPGLLLVPSGADGPRLVGEQMRRSAGVWLLTQGIAASYGDGIRAMESDRAVIAAEGEDLPEGYGVRPTVLTADLESLVPGSRLLEECFGPVAIVAEYDDVSAALDVLASLQPSLAGSAYGDAESDPDLERAVAILSAQTGRVVVNGSPNGVACVDAIHHGGPWPATSNPATTSVGAAALGRFTRPVAFQNVPEAALPPALRASDPWGVQGG